MMGYLLVVAAGVLQGSFMVPMKFTRRWEWENTWLGFATTAYLVWPWLIAWATIPHLLTTFASTSTRCFILVELFGLGWGLGALTFGLGIAMVGVSLGFTIILGLAASAGALIPLVVLDPEKLLQGRGLLTMGALVLVLVGIALCSWAGSLRQPAPSAGQEQGKSNFGLGLVVCSASGLLSSCGNLGFAFGGEVIRRAIQHGTAESMAGNSLWAVITIPLFLVNAVYCFWLLKKRRTAGLFFARGTGFHWLLAATMGLLWIGGFLCYAPGVRLLGPLGTSVGWAMMLSVMVITANLSGFLTGEWRGASRKAYGLLLGGVAILIVAIGAVGYANRL
jgi:L-rhamnose-H+ transport protein